MKQYVIDVNGEKVEYCVITYTNEGYSQRKRLTSIEFEKHLQTGLAEKDFVTSKSDTRNDYELDHDGVMYLLSTAFEKAMDEITAGEYDDVMKDYANIIGIESSSMFVKLFAFCAAGVTFGVELFGDQREKQEGVKLNE